MENNKVYAKGFKGFNLDFTCNGKQYSENTVFEEPKAEICECGMHFCKNPWDVFYHYPMINNDCTFNVYSTVEALDDVIENDDNDSKCCTKKLKIGKVISLFEYIDVCIKYTHETMVDGDDTIASSDNDDTIANSGDRAKIGSSGNDARIGSSGNAAQIGSSGDYAQIGSSGDYAQIGSSGDYARVASSGDCARVASSGENSVISCIGIKSIAKAGVGSWITLAEWVADEPNKRYIPKCVKTEYVDGKRIKADTFYKLENGEFVEVDS